MYGTFRLADVVWFLLQQSHAECSTLPHIWQTSLLLYFGLLSWFWIGAVVCCWFWFVGFVVFFSRRRFLHSAHLCPWMPQWRHWSSNLRFFRFACGWLLVLEVVWLEGCCTPIWFKGCALDVVGINCANWHRLCTNLLISSIGASWFPATASSFCICTGIFAKRNVSVLSTDLSTNACFATFLNLFRKSLNVSIVGSYRIWSISYLATSFTFSMAYSFLKYLLVKKLSVCWSWVFARIQWPRRATSSGSMSISFCSSVSRCWWGRRWFNSRCSNSLYFYLLHRKCGTCVCSIFGWVTLSFIDSLRWWISVIMSSMWWIDDCGYLVGGGRSGSSDELLWLLSLCQNHTWCRG